MDVALLYGAKWPCRSSMNKYLKLKTHVATKHYYCHFLMPMKHLSTASFR